jgi:hypothetical protein
VAIGVAYVVIDHWRRRSRRITFWRQKAAELDYQPDSRRPVEVPVGHDGRPGYTISVPSRVTNLRDVARGGDHADFQTLVGPRTVLAVVCFGGEQARPSVEESAQATMSSLPAMGATVSEPVTSERLASEPSVRYRFRTSHLDVIEWKFKRDGWLFAVGIQSVEPDPEAELRALECLGTWTWSPALHGQTHLR